MSAILSADTLNDFIAPSVACIKPIETLPAEPENPSLEHEVILDGASRPKGSASGPAQISLTDCLACSGCVTSAEAVLISLQSHSEVLNTLDAAPALKIDGAGAAHVLGLEDEGARIFVASVAPQVRANLAAACGKGVSEATAGRMLERLLTEELARGGKWGNSFTWVVDTNVAREACLVLSAEEALAAAESSGTSSKPVLASACPGWVCYAEKTHPYVLPYLSKVKSPQALMGTVLKSTLSKKLGVSPSRIWHLAVMPCFDKKLEASREELTDRVWGEGCPSYSVRDVDCVITSKEVLMLAESRGLSFFDLAGGKAAGAPRTPFPDATLEKFLFPSHHPYRSPREASTSGGYLHFILETVASKNPGSQIQGVRGRNADVMEYTVVSPTGEVIFKAARFYGFRNIQNLVRKLKPAKPSRMPGGKPFGSARRPTGKPGTLDYSYVEVMACPGGCTNGGGQIKVDDPVIIERAGQETPTKPGPHEQKEWLALIDEAYFSGNEGVEADVAGGPNGTASQVEERGSDDKVGGISSAYIKDTLEYWSGVTGIDIDRLALTSFREVVSDVGKTKTQIERAAQLAGKIGGGW